MKIIKLTAENVKKLTAVEISPDGNIVQITGKNGQGKTSVLDCIWWALAGTKNIQAQPIKKGQTKARITLDMGELVVERRFTESGSTISVETAEGARFPSPQKMLDELLGSLSFDPLAFGRMDPRKQYDELRRISEIDVDIDQLDALNKGDYAKRTDVNRDAKAKRAQADAVVVAEGLPEQPLDESKLLDEIQAAGESNTALEQRKANRASAAEQIKTLAQDAKLKRDQAEALRVQATRLDEEAVKVEAAAADLEKKLADAPALPDPIDVAAIRVKLEHAKQINAKIVKRGERERVVAEAKELEAKSQALTDAMEARDKTKADAIARAKMPVHGIGFGAGFVTYNGVPFEQASSAEQLRVSLSIAMAANPKLRVIRIQDGSLLDDDSMAQIAAMAKDLDYQVWIERVDGSGKIGFVLEDGHIKQPIAEAA